MTLCWKHSTQKIVVIDKKIGRRNWKVKKGRIKNFSSMSFSPFYLVFDDWCGDVLVSTDYTVAETEEENENFLYMNALMNMVFDTFLLFTEKPGTCPVMKERQDCITKVDECKNDFECYGTSKCCSDGCRKICRDQSGGKWCGSVDFCMWYLFDDAELLEIQELRKKYEFTTGPRICFYIWRWIARVNWR